MSHDLDLFSDIIYSIPANAHSVAQATRRITAGYTQHSKYVPDHGGVLDTPNSFLKIRSLEQEMPFKPRPSRFNLPLTNDYTSQTRPVTEDCLIATSYLENVDRVDKLSIIRALNTHLHVDLVDSTIQKTLIDRPVSTCYAHVPYTEVITGVKLVENLNDIVIVKFDNGVKLIKLNPAFRLDQESGDSSDASNDDLNSNPSEAALGFLATINERIGQKVRDCCMNPFNKTIIATASDNFESQTVKLYDLTRPRQPYHSISWLNEDSGDAIEQHISDGGGRSEVVRKRTLRSFKPSKRVIDGIKQFDHIPSHLANMMLTDTRKVILIDPRLDKPGQVYVERGKIPSFYPLEFIRRFAFSSKNTHQFYSLTNIHLRVFDTRYPCCPMSQINHMLNSETFDVMNLKIIPYDDSTETVCSSSLGRLSFLTFDHARAETLANPCSSHHPYHDPEPAEVSDDDSEELFGLAIVTEPVQNPTSSLFSVLQLSSSGAVCYRRYESRDSEPDLDVNNDLDHSVAMAHEKNERLLRARTQDQVEEDSDATEIIPYDSDTEMDDNSDTLSLSADEINILDPNDVADLDSRIESKRAKEAYEKMKNKLGVDS